MNVKLEALKEGYTKTGFQFLRTFFSGTMVRCTPKMSSISGPEYRSSNRDSMAIKVIFIFALPSEICLLYDGS